jgi:hypothetical protein
MRRNIHVQAAERSVKNLSPVRHFSAWCTHQTLLGVCIKLCLVGTPNPAWCTRQTLLGGHTKECLVYAPRSVRPARGGIMHELRRALFNNGHMT